MSNNHTFSWRLVAQRVGQTASRVGQTIGSHQFSWRYIAGRVGQSLFVLFGAYTATFWLLQAQPGDAVMIRFENPELGLSPEQIAVIRESYGIDDPAVSQYLHALAGNLHGDFGYSVANGQSVSRKIFEALPSTLQLAGYGLALAIVLALGLIALSTLTRLSWLRDTLRALPGLFVAVPTFWLGILLIRVFSFQLGWIPSIRPGPVLGLILPVLTVAVPLSAPLAQVLARTVDQVLTQPFVAVEQAKGASWRRVVTRTVARNVLVPAFTLAGIIFGEMVGGAVVTEHVFGRAGVGTVTIQALNAQDLPVIQAVVVLSAATFVVINLLVDLLVPLIDPRLGGSVGGGSGKSAEAGSASLLSRLRRDESQEEQVKKDKSADEQTQEMFA